MLGKNSWRVKLVIKVVNKYKEPNHINCGRGSALGNPMEMHDESDRDAVCDFYERWFYSRVDEPNFLYNLNKPYWDKTPQEQMLKNLFRLALKQDVNLGCSCAPKRCHCDTIKTFLENKLEEYWK